MRSVNFPAPELPEGAEALRLRVREFLAEALRDVPLSERALSWDACNPSSAVVWGKPLYRGELSVEYGGGGRSQMERFVVLEECLAAGAPTGLHWFADRQSGPLILRYRERGAQAEHPAENLPRGNCASVSA